VTQGTDTALANWIGQEGLVDPLILQGCLAEVRQRRWSDPDMSLAVLLIDRRLVAPARLAEGMSTLAGPLQPRRGVSSSDGDLPERFGPFLVLRELARGGMGAVLEVVHDTSGIRYALKVLRPSLMGGFSEDEEELERFEREAELTARLDHPHIVRIHAADFEARHPYQVQDLLPGGTLQARIEAPGGMPVDEAVSVALKLARALQHAHERGVLHRDLKPLNVLFDDRGEPRVVDWGLSRSLREATVRLTVAGSILGTPGYMPPEQATGAESAESAADVYALGAILFAMLTGRPPFQGPRPLLVLDKVLHNPPPMLRSLRKNLPQAAGDVLEAIVGRALAKAPEDRPGLEEVIEVLNRLDRGEVQALALEPTSHPRLWLAGALSLLVALGLGVWFALPHGPSFDERLGTLAHALDALESEAVAACHTRTPSGEPSQAGADLERELSELAKSVPQHAQATHRALLERARQHVRLAEWRGGQEPRVGGAGALGALVDALILRGRREPAKARRAARRALHVRRSLAAWTLSLQLAQHDDEALFRLVSDLQASDPEGARRLALTFLEPAARRALQAFPSRERPSLQTAPLAKAKRGVDALRRLGCPRDRLEAIVAQATEANALGWVALLDALSPQHTTHALRTLAELSGGAPVALGATLRAELATWITRQAVASREVSRELSIPGRTSRGDRERREQGQRVLHRALLCDQALLYHFPELAPGWRTPPALVVNAVAQILVLERHTSSVTLECAFLALRSEPKSRLDLSKIGARVSHAESKELAARFPLSRAAALLDWQVSLRATSRSLEGLEFPALQARYDTLLGSVVRPTSPDSVDDLHASYLGNAEMLLADVASRQISVLMKSEPALVKEANQAAERALPWARQAQRRELPKGEDHLFRCCDMEATALLQLDRGQEALANWRVLLARLEKQPTSPLQRARLGRAWERVGRLHLRLRDPASGLHAFERADHFYRRGHDTWEQLPVTRRGASRCLYYLDRKQEAWRRLDVENHPESLVHSYDVAAWTLELCFELFGAARAGALLARALAADGPTRAVGGGKSSGLKSSHKLLLRQWAQRVGVPLPKPERPDKEGGR
jgi:serine/threonine protein kinase